MDGGFGADGEANHTGTKTVLPIVTLKNGIRGEKAQDGSWNLDV